MISTVWKYGDKDIDDARIVRHKVFIEEQNVPEELEWDEIDAISKHLLVYEDEKCIGTARLYFLNNEEGKKGIYHLGRIALLKEHRGKKIGDLILRTCLYSAFFYENANVVEISAQMRVMGFYEKFGFKAYGEKYLDAGIWHMDMRVTKDTLVLSHCNHD